MPHRTPCTDSAHDRARRLMPHRTPCIDGAHDRAHRLHDPSHSLHRERSRPCSQIDAPPHSLHLERRRPCGQALHTLHVRTLLHPVLARPEVLRGSLPLRAALRQLISALLIDIDITDVHEVDPDVRPPNSSSSPSRARRAPEVNRSLLTRCTSRRPRFQKYLTRSQSKTLRGEWAARTRTARPPRGGTTMRAARATARTGERAANGAGGTAVPRRSRARDRDPENPGGVSVAAAEAAAGAGAGAGGDRGGNTGDDTNAGAAVAAPAARATRATPRMPAGSWNFYERRRRTR